MTFLDVSAPFFDTASAALTWFNRTGYIQSDYTETLKDLLNALANENEGNNVARDVYLARVQKWINQHYGQEETS